MPGSSKNYFVDGIWVRFSVMLGACGGTYCLR